jgi:hypothetical protein
MRGRIEDLLPGDGIGFSGCDPASIAVNLATWGVPFIGLSHFAIVSTHPHGKRGLVLWESTTLCRQPCLVQHRVVSGVQCHRARARIAGYCGRVYHYPLSRCARIKLMQAELGDIPSKLTLNDWLLSLAGTGYDSIGAFRSRSTPLGWLERRLSTESKHSLFCSELVACAWKLCGLWSPPDCRFNPNRLARLAYATGVIERGKRIK